ERDPCEQARSRAPGLTLTSPTWLRQRGLEERKHAAPRLLGLRFVIDARIRRTPAVQRTGVNLYLRRQVRLCEGLSQQVLRLGVALVVVLRDRKEKVRLHLRD